MQYLCEKIIHIIHEKESFTVSFLMFRFSAGISMLRTTGIGPALIWGRLLKCTPSRSEDWCMVCHYYYKNSKSYTFGTDYQFEVVCQWHSLAFFKKIIEEKQCYFMQDGTAAHSANYSIHILNEGFEDWLLSHRMWPARSPDLHPLWLLSVGKPK